jgi:GrpB-like predicted nucleotidyltransferase (UPF0157 family)
MTNSPHQSPDEEIRLAAYDPRWPGPFAEEAARLADVIGRWATGGIHHVGSTAVPGLVAKPVIDILVGVDGLEESLPCIDLLAPLYYMCFPYLPHEMHWLCKPNPSRRTHHLHLVPTESERFSAELSFRDYLRTHAARAHEYEQLKRTLATSHRHDREAYTAGKAEFVQSTLDLADSCQ